MQKIVEDCSSMHITNYVHRVAMIGNTPCMHMQTVHDTTYHNMYMYVYQT